jgi:hypothetical protein
MAFNVKQHLIRVNGGKDYLPVAYRLVWFREEHGDWGIQTDPIVCDVEKGIFLWHARITNAEGRVVAEGSKMETIRGFADAAEKSETGAIGRALGVLGYGTQFCPEFDEGTERIVDSPMLVGNGNSSGNGIVQPSSPKQNGVANIGRDFATCEQCGRALTKGQADISQHKYGKPLCPAHQVTMKI